MFKNYLKTAWRNLTRQKWYSLINIFGLAVGMAASILLFIYISHERSFDKFHQEGEKTYRLVSYFHGKMDDAFPRAFHQLGPMMKEMSPQVSEQCRLKNETYTLRYDDKKFEWVTTLMADATFADFFHFPAIRGDVKKTLSDPSGIVLSSELAQKIFADEDPIGKVISYPSTMYDMEARRFHGQYRSVTVGAVLAPMPENTHLQFDALIAFEAYDPSYLETFSNDVFVFLKVEGQDPDLESIAQISQGFFEDLGAPIQIDNYLQPLYEIHFGPKYSYDFGPKGNLQLIIIFSLVALFIISIAVINFINLITARSEKRAVEACIRKVSGAGKRDIFGQFLGESLLMSLLSFFLAMVMVELFLTPFSGLLNRELTLSAMESIGLFIKLLGVVVMIGVLAGMYPAILFSRFNPAEIMRGKFRGSGRNPLLRIVLVVIQFAISVILIISISVFNRQVDYMKNSSLGFEPEHVMHVSGLSSTLFNGYEALRAELLQNPRILEVGSGQAMPGYSGSGQSIRPAEGTEDQNISINEYRVREGYKESFGLELVSGRWFDFDNSADSDNFVMNETAIQALGFDDPVGKEISMHHRKGRIIGVVRDFHFGSLRRSITPLMFTAYSSAFYNIIIKTSGEDHPQTVDYIRSVFAGFDSNYNFKASYISDRFESFYRQEEQQNTILNYASFLAIIIAMLGLLGLSSYIVVSRTKEIGIRKILGASGIQIIAVLFRDIGRWVLLANLVAWPLAWYAMEEWLGRYPYRIDMSFGYLLLAGTITFLIAALTISTHTWKAARANPVDAIRGE
ncbi:MAG: ABC transporter permease [Bacteroidales bacterium]